MMATDRTTLGGRIRMAREAAGLTQGDVARRTGAGRSPTVSDWESDRVIPEGSMLVQLPRVLKCDGHWLLTGEGPMRRTDPAHAARIVQRIRKLLEEGEA